MDDICFVIQPFDKDKFDKRYHDTFSPSIRAAGLEPYRTDLDPSVSIPIDTIESHIKKAKICLAEITTDNPNVWFELGYALALNKDVIMVSEEKEKFPFDVQHRSVISYKTDSQTDYQILGQQITQVLQARLKLQSEISGMRENPLQEREGLNDLEVAMLFILLENQILTNETPATRLIRDMVSAGYTIGGTNLASLGLIDKKLIDRREKIERDERYVLFSLTKAGKDWILRNQHLLRTRIAK